MDTSKIGITSANGYPFLSYDERFALIKKHGFEKLMLWWGEDENTTREERVALAQKHGLEIENAHSEMRNSNCLWENGEAGDIKAAEHIRAVTDCARFGIRRMIIHMSNFDNPPDVSEIGVSRLERIIKCAIENDVTLAVENVRTSKHIRYILDHYRDSHVGFCYDTGHNVIWCHDTDWLTTYKDRLVALHIHDNLGDYDSHIIPFTGIFNWNKFMHDIRLTSYSGCLSLETEYKGTDTSEFEVFLEESHKAALRLASL